MRLQPAEHTGGEPGGNLDLAVEVEERIELRSSGGALRREAGEDLRRESRRRGIGVEVQEAVEPDLDRALLLQPHEDAARQRFGQPRLGERREESLERLLLLEETAALAASEEVRVPGETRELLVRGPSEKLGLQRGAEFLAVRAQEISSAR
jgi:hypothetical protein